MKFQTKEINEFKRKVLDAKRPLTRSSQGAAGNFSMLLKGLDIGNKRSSASPSFDADTSILTSKLPRQLSLLNQSVGGSRAPSDAGTGTFVRRRTSNVESSVEDLRRIDGSKDFESGVHRFDTEEKQEKANFNEQTSKEVESLRIKEMEPSVQASDGKQ